MTLQPPAIGPGIPPPGAILAARLDEVADGLSREARAARSGYEHVVWDDDARRDLTRHLDGLDADLAGLVQALRERAAALRRPRSWLP